MPRGPQIRPGLQQGRSLTGPDAPHSWMHWPSSRSQEPSCGSWNWKWGYICTAEPLPKVCGGNVTCRELYITLAAAVTAYVTSSIMSQGQRWGRATGHRHSHSLEFPLYTKSGVTARNLSVLVLWWTRGRVWVAIAHVNTGRVWETEDPGAGNGLRGRRQGRFLTQRRTPAGTCLSRPSPTDEWTTFNTRFNKTCHF